MQIERASDPPSDPPETFDVGKETYFRLSVGQLAKLIALVAAAVLAVAAVLPNILPKKWTIATQTFVEESVSAAKAKADEQAKKNVDAIEDVQTEVRFIKVKVESVEEVQVQSRAAQEADRVTRHIRSGDRRMQEYQRVYEAAKRNLKSKEPREPLEGVQLP